jgi:hypothetical protein
VTGYAPKFKCFVGCRLFGLLPIPVGFYRLGVGSFTSPWFYA